MSHDVLISELFKKIPPAGAAWPMADRDRWLRATASVLDLLYGDNRVIEIGPLPPRSEPAQEPAQEPVETETKLDELAPNTPAPDDLDKVAAEMAAPPAAPAPIEKKPDRTSRTRPVDVPSNLTMALAAIEALDGAAAAPQILKWCREHYNWPGMPETWTSVLWTFSAEGKLARAGINFTKPKPVAPPAPKPAAAAAPPPPKPAAPAPTAPAPAPKPAPIADDSGVPFEHKGRKAMLHKKEWRLATALVRAMGKGHLDYAFLVNAANAGEKRPSVGDKQWLTEMFEVLKPKLFELGLDVIHSPNFGYSVREVEPANG